MRFPTELALIAAAAAITGVPAASAAPPGTPVAVIETLHQGLVGLSQGEDGNLEDLDRRYRELESLIEATHDLAYIAEFTIRRQWPTLSESERRRFVEAFERLSVMTYATRFVRVTEDTFRIDRFEEARSGRARVVAAIRRASGPDVPLEYLLHRAEGGWRIVNIVADGVSDLALKRAEYQRILSDGTVESLVKHLEEQTAPLESDAAQRTNR